MLKSFSLNKVPGDDGLPVEFYKTFWVTVGGLLVKCYNESYEKGEMSSSQKQAIITLIDKKRPRSLRSQKLETHFSFKCGRKDSIKSYY